MTMRFIGRIATIFLVTVLVASFRNLATSAQQPQDISEGDVIRVNTTLVTVPVRVMDRKNRYISDLRQEQFRVFENGVEQQIAYFASADKPFTVALLLDISDSTQAQLKLIQEAAIAFIDRLRPEDQVFVIAFDSRVRLLVQPTRDREPVRTAIQGLQSGKGTSLYAVVQTTIKEFPDSIFGRKAIVLLTDGADTTSPEPFTFKSSVQHAAESDVTIYPVEINARSDLNPSDPEYQLRLRFPEGKAATVEAVYAQARDYLHQLAEKTGGQENVATDLRRLDQAFARVAEELRRQFSLGYYPKTPAQAGETREIKVTVDQPNAIVHARANYTSGARATNPSGAKP
jgi:Ca-activated chloride channel homolog